MGWLLFIAFIYYLVHWISNKDTSGGTGSGTGNNHYGQPNNTPGTSPVKKNTYRPKVSGHTSGRSIVFNDSSSNIHSSANKQLDLTGLVDAFTGAPLDASLGLYRCNNCSVFYHTQSFEVLRSENTGRCVACSSTQIVVFVPGTTQTTGRNFSPGIITLENFRSHVGRVVTFEGYVHNVLRSRRGSDYAVMFENTSWTKGFKLVFFRGTITGVGGERYIMALKGKSIRVRGLLVNHPRFGYEIIVSEKSMILDVKL